MSKVCTLVDEAILKRNALNRHGLLFVSEAPMAFFSSVQKFLCLLHHTSSKAGHSCITHILMANASFCNASVMWLALNNYNACVIPKTIVTQHFFNL